MRKFGESLHHVWHGLTEPPIGGQSALFHSARLKLTGFYLAVILAFSLVLTLSVRTFAEHEFNHAGVAQRGAVNNLLYDLYSVPPNPDTTFNRFQSQQNITVRHHLDVDVIVVNVLALLAGGILSYWYAGRTLRPIEEAHEAQTRFAADASHELRTPLANLKVENEVFLRQKKFTSDEAKALIESNLEEVQRLENLATNLLALTQYGQTSLKLSPTRMSPVIAEALQLADKGAQAQRIHFEQQLAEDVVLGNLDSLIQLIGIIIDNAIKYSPEGSTVWIDGVKAGNQYHLSIRDEGSGIAEVDLPHIFDRLYRSDKSRTSKTHGYGLGLSLAQEIARANKGSITGRNYPSGGAQFVVSLMLIKP